jgi:hypothetical protein
MQPYTLRLRDDSAQKTIVVILADTGERYVTTDLFAQSSYGNRA